MAITGTVNPNSGPQGTSFQVHVEGLGIYAGNSVATVQLFRSGSGYRLDNPGPVQITSSGIVDFTPSIPYGSIYDVGTYEVGVVIWASYPDKLRSQSKFSTFVITPSPEPGVLRGTVTDIASQTPILPFAGIFIAQNGVGKYSQTTDSNGNYTQDELPPGTYQVTASGPDHDSKTLDAVITSSQTTTLNFQLNPSGTSECPEGTTKCEGYALYQCIGGKWVSKEVKSIACGYSEPPVVSEGNDLLSLILAVSPLVFVGGMIGIGEFSKKPRSGQV